MPFNWTIVPMRNAEIYARKGIFGSKKLLSPLTLSSGLKLIRVQFYSRPSMPAS